jgi:GMP synthase (glutamine-hydrolysing)
MNAPLRFLLLQVRNPDDPMRRQEIDCFARALPCDPARILVLDLLREVPSRRLLARVDVVLLGGSGDYSVAEGGRWLEPALAAMRELHDRAKPTFASCWGFQALARALGGSVVTDPERAELGTLPVRLTAAGRLDPVFGGLPATFVAAMGHQDRVERLPAGAVLLASTDRVRHQAFRFEGKPIYCTQFHPELDAAAFCERVRAYPAYLERIHGVPLAQFARGCRETPDAASLLPRFLRHVCGDR